MPPFALLPVEMALDTRLGRAHFRVLIALLSFRRRNTDQVWPSRAKLSERCGYPTVKVSKITSELVELGWLEKIGGGGRGKSVQYRVLVPEQITALYEETVTPGVTVSPGKTVTPVGYKNGNPRGLQKQKPPGVTRIGTEQEQSIEHTPAGASVCDALAEACGLERHTLTRSEEARLEQAAAELAEAGADAEEIARRAKLYRQRWPSVALTPQALAANWSRFGAEKRPGLDPKAQAALAERRRVVELLGWCQTHVRLLGDPADLARGSGETPEAWRERVRAAWAQAKGPEAAPGRAAARRPRDRGKTRAAG